MLETYRTETRESTRKRPRHEWRYATTKSVVQRARAVKRWYYGSARHGDSLSHQRLYHSHRRALELHLAGCSYREIRETLGYRAHSHLHKLVQENRAKLLAIAAYGDGWEHMTDAFEVFEELDMPLPPVQEGCSLPRGGSESYDMYVVPPKYLLSPRARAGPPGNDREEDENTETGVGAAPGQLELPW